MRNLWLLFLVALTTGFIGEKKLMVSSQSPSSATDDMYLEGRPSGDLPIDDEDGDDDGSGSGSGDYAFSEVTDQEELLNRFLNFSKTTVSKEMVPVQPEPTADPHIPPTTRADDHVHTDMRETTPYVLTDGEDKEEAEVPGFGPTADRFPELPSSTNKPPLETTEFSIDITVTKESNEDNSLDWNLPTSEDGKDSVSSKVEEDNEIRADGRSGVYAVNPPEEVTSENLWERTEVLAAIIACGVVGFLCAVFLLLLLAYRMKKKDEGSYDLGDTKLSSTSYHKAPTKEFYA